MKYRAESILEKWGNCWARTRIGTEYPSTTISIPVLPSTKRKAWLVHLSDDECVKIEKQVMKLHADNLLQYQILMAVYVQQANDNAVATALNISRATFYRERIKGLRFLDGAFAGANINLNLIG